MMLLSIDNLASKYHLLPSEAMSRASTFDLYVLDVSAKWVKYQQDLANGKGKITPTLTTEQMQAMIDKVRGKQ